MSTPANRPPRRLVEGGNGSASHGRLGLLLEGMRPTPPAPGMAERVWRGLRRRNRPVRAGRAWNPWWLGASAVAAATAAAVLFAARPTPPAPRSLEVLLAAGDVRVTEGAEQGDRPAAAGMLARSGARVTTGAESRSFLRSAEFGALLTENAEAVVASGEAPYVALRRGEVSVSVHARRGATPFLVRAGGYEVRVTGTVFSVAANDAVKVSVAEGAVEVVGNGLHWRVAAGECWSSAFRAVERCPASAQLVTAKALAAQGGPRARLRLDGPAGLRVRSGSIDLGRTPIDWLAPAGPRHLVGSVGLGSVAADLVLTPDADQRHSFELPASAPQRLAVSETPDGADGTEGAEGSRRWLEGALEQNRINAAREAQRRRPARTAAERGEAAPAEGLDVPRLPGPAPMSAEGPASEPVQPAPVSSNGGRQTSSTGAADARDPDARRYRLAKELSRSGHHAEAVEVLTRIAESGGTFAEVAQYDIGWILARQLRDPAGAVKACDEYRRRHPDGRLRQEVDLNLVEALADSGQRQRALAEADAFLARYPASERGRAVGLLRAHLLCELGAFQASTQAFAALANGVDGVADDASFFGAVCLERSNLPQDARAWLEAYRSRFPNGLHHTEVERMLASP